MMGLWGVEWKILDAWLQALPTPSPLLPPNFSPPPHSPTLPFLRAAMQATCDTLQGLLFVSCCQRKEQKWNTGTANDIWAKLYQPVPESKYEPVTGHAPAPKVDETGNSKCVTWVKLWAWVPGHAPAPKVDENGKQQMRNMSQTTSQSLGMLQLQKWMKMGNSKCVTWVKLWASPWASSNSKSGWNTGNSACLTWVKLWASLLPTTEPRTSWPGQGLKLWPGSRRCHRQYSSATKHLTWVVTNRQPAFLQKHSWLVFMVAYCVCLIIPVYTKCCKCIQLLMTSLTASWYLRVVCCQLLVILNKSWLLIL